MSTDIIVLLIRTWAQKTHAQNAYILYVPLDCDLVDEHSLKRLRCLMSGSTWPIKPSTCIDIFTQSSIALPFFPIPSDVVAAEEVKVWPCETNCGQNGAWFPFPGSDLRRHPRCRRRCVAALMLTEVPAKKMRMWEENGEQNELSVFALNGTGNIEIAIVPQITAAPIVPVHERVRVFYSLRDSFNSAEYT
ncbi:hypothetical protein JOB18_006191 [Solea senegalensis]|uniref:Uncharacterized protein n=1 Tax=Solea senegalensis TaxID=28829 RepID=A0AAV6SQJ5_SOLSE|nr:hypothetical protein JOB18_006191 [Solea senegalensis]